jgi:hypothetical protein
MAAMAAAVVLDTETTDLDGVVIEIAVVDACTGETLLDTLVNPGGVPVSAGARAVHGITDDELAAAPCWADVVPRFLAAAGARRNLAYNAFTCQTSCREWVCRDFNTRRGVTANGGGDLDMAPAVKAPAIVCLAVLRTLLGYGLRYLSSSKAKRGLHCLRISSATDFRHYFQVVAYLAGGSGIDRCDRGRVVAWAVSGCVQRCARVPRGIGDGRGRCRSGRGRVVAWAVSGCVQRCARVPRGIGDGRGRCRSGRGRRWCLSCGTTSGQAQYADTDSHGYLQVSADDHSKFPHRLSCIFQAECGRGEQLWPAARSGAGH